MLQLMRTPAPGGWRLILTSNEAADRLEALITPEHLASCPIEGGKISLRIAGDRCHLMPSEPAKQSLSTIRQRLQAHA